MKKYLLSLIILSLSQFAVAQSVTPVKLRLNDLPPGTTVNWVKVSHDKEYYFYVPPGSACKQQQTDQNTISNYCELGDIKFFIHWSDVANSTVNKSALNYSIKQDTADGSTYVLESYETDTSDVYKFVGKIKTADGQVWATLAGQCFGANKINLVFEIFYQITKDSNIGKE